MKLIYTCDSVNGKDVVSYTGVAEINQIIGRLTPLIGEANYGLVYRISVPLNTQYINKDKELVKVSEIIEWNSYMSFYDKLIEIINGRRLPKDWCKEINGELVIDIRNAIFEPWHYENWYASKRYATGESKEYSPKRCSIKTVVSKIEE